MLTSAAAQSSEMTFNPIATAKLIEAAQGLRYKNVIDFAELNGNINATFTNTKGIEVTPLKHLVDNIDSFVSDGFTIGRVNKFKGKVVAVGATRVTTKAATAAGNPVEFTQRMLELGADANFAAPLLSAAQQYPLENPSFTDIKVKKPLLGKIVTLLVEHGADVHVKDDGKFKEGLFFQAARIAGKDPAFPVVQPKASLYDAIVKGGELRAFKTASALRH